MTKTVRLSNDCQRDYRKLKKKYRSLDKDVALLVDRLSKGDFSIDDSVSGLGGVVYKARIKSSDQKKGKSGGFRAIYYTEINDCEIIILTIYAKAQQENISAKEIIRLLESLGD